MAAVCGSTVYILRPQPKQNTSHTSDSHGGCFKWPSLIAYVYFLVRWWLTHSAHVNSTPRSSPTDADANIGGSAGHRPRWTRCKSLEITPRPATLSPWRQRGQLAVAVEGWYVLTRAVPVTAPDARSTWRQRVRHLVNRCAYSEPGSVGRSRSAAVPPSLIVRVKTPRAADNDVNCCVSFCRRLLY